MITVQKPLSPKVTEIENQISRVRMRGNASSKKIKELRALKLAGQHNVNDSESRIAMILADKEIPAASDVDAQITTEMLNWEATEEAERSLKPKLAAAKYEASTAVLNGLKKPHDEVVQRVVSPLVEVAKAWNELFQLSRDLKDKEVGWRDGVCDLVPALVELFGANNVHSPLASFLQEAVKANYVKASALPKELRAS
jgi:hypothetical protein